MKRLVWGIVLLLGFIAFYYVWPKEANLPKLGTVQSWPLTEVSGATIANGKPKLVTFFFTNCPDICPMTMIDIVELQQLMREKGIQDDEYEIISVTLDPEYDTNERILQYKELFDVSSTNWLFLRGSEEDTNEFTQYFNFFYEKSVEGFVTHSTLMYVVDGKNRIRVNHNMAVGNKRVNIEAVASHLEQLIN